VTQKNASQTEEMSATAQTLTEQAVQLRELVGHFKLSTGTARPAPGGSPTGALPRSRSSTPAKKRPEVAAKASRNGHAHELDRLAPNADDGFTEF
jgi:methyl-accepting chemotaxis protein